MGEKERLDRILSLEKEEEVLAGLHAMQDDGSLFVLFPELQEGERLEQRKEYHAYTVLEHNLRACAAAKPLYILRLSALLHDIGKPFIRREDGHMYGHDLLGAEMAEKALLRLCYEKETVELAVSLIRHHMFDLKGAAKEKSIKKHFKEWGLPFCELLTHLREADVYGSGRTPRTEPIKTAERFKKVMEEIRTEAEREAKKPGKKGRK